MKTVLASAAVLVAMFAAMGFSHRSPVAPAHAAAALESPVAPSLPREPVEFGPTVAVPETVIVASPKPIARPAKHVETDAEHVARLMTAPQRCGRVMPTDSDMWIGVSYCGR